MTVRPFTWLAFSFFGYFCAYGVFIPFFPAWLKSQSYGEEMIGLVLASSYLFRFIGGIFFSVRVKRADQLLSNLRMLAWAGVVIMILISLSAEYFFLLFIAIGLFGMVNSAGIPLTDTLATIWQQQIRLDYGKARLIGSIAFVIGVTVFGYIISLVGEQKIVWMLTALLTLYALLQMCSPQPRPQDFHQSAVKKSIGFIELLKNKTTLRLLIAASLVQGSHAGYYVYSVLYWTEQGIAIKTTSLLWGLAVIAEILLFFFSKRLFKHRSVAALFYFSTVAAIIRWGLFSLSNEVWFIAILQILHCFTFAMMHYAMIRYIATQPQNTMAKLQSLYNGFASCAAVALFSVLAGMIYPSSAPMVFYTMAGAAACAVLIIPRKSKTSLVKRN
ncbi:MAG TPA: 3-phenylpropionate MFS transporter [Pasteurellaceae bacterium]|nr:3-phenylpropionate MFS transporter [Pasteurellaceae bacterium]